MFTVALRRGFKHDMLFTQLAPSAISMKRTACAKAAHCGSAQMIPIFRKSQVAGVSPCARRFPSFRASVSTLTEDLAEQASRQNLSFLVESRIRDRRNTPKVDNSQQPRIQGPIEPGCGITAVASISTSASSSTRPATTTMVMAGKWRPSTRR